MSGYRNWLVAWVPTEATTKEYPSGALRATFSDPRLPAAPTGFQRPTGWPSGPVVPLASRRAEVSVLPPAAKPTTKRIGRSGVQPVAADAVPVTAGRAGRIGVAIRARVNVRRCINAVF